MKKIFKLMVLSKSAMLFFFLTLLAQIFSAIFHYIYPRYLQNLIDQYFIPWFEGKNPLAAIFLSLLGQLAVWVAAFLLIGVLGHWCLKVGNYRARLTLSDTIFDQY